MNFGGIKFKKLKNHSEIENISEYIEEYKKKVPDVKIYIGCDSQNIKKSTIYATVIILHHPRIGGHVLYNKEVVPFVKDRWLRLWDETDRAVKVAEYLKTLKIKTDHIDLDYNEDPYYFSNNLLRAAIGYVESQGYKARWKPHSVAATQAADTICK